MKLNGKFKQVHTVKYAWLISYMSIAVFSIIIFNVSFNVFQNMFKDAITDIQSATAKHISHSIDSNLSIMQQFAQNIATAHVITDELLTASDNDIPYLKYTLPIRELKKNLAYTSIVNNFYIYIPKTNKIITSVTTASPEMIYSSYHNTQLGFDEWFERLTSNTPMLFFVESIGEGLASQPYLFYIQTMKSASGNPFNVIVMSKLSATWQQNGDFIQKNNLVIYGKTEPIFLSNDFQIPSNFNVSIKTNSIIYDRVKNEKYIVSIVNSEFTLWKYIFFTPHSVYWSNVNFVRGIIFLTSFLSILITVIISFYLTNKNYRPLKNVLSAFGTKITATNEYSYITKNINNIVYEKNILSRKNEEMTQNIFLERLLKGHIPYTEKSNCLLRKNNIVCEKNNITVVVFRIDNYKNLFPDDKYIGDTPPIEMVSFLIDNVAKDMIKPLYTSFFCSIDENAIFIINTNDDNNDQIVSLLFEMRNKLSKYVFIDTSVAVSSQCSNIYEVKNAYFECLYALDHQKLFNDGGYNGNVVVYDDIIRLNNLYSYTAKDENRIINAIISSDIELALSYIDEMFNKNLKIGISAELARLFIFDLITTILKLSASLSLSSETKTLVFNTLLGSNTVASARENITFVTKILCNCFSDKNINKKTSDTVKSIIYENYQEATFSVAEIGYRLDRTPAYISKLFKRETGENLSTFINKYRINISKQLLANTNLSIKEIATNVGFSNSNSFIYAFKNIEGITPGQYKQTLQG